MTPERDAAAHMARAVALATANLLALICGPLTRLRRISLSAGRRVTRIRGAHVLFVTPVHRNTLGKV